MSIERSSVSIIILVSLVSIPNGKLVAKYSLISQLDLKVLNSNNNFYSITLSVSVTVTMDMTMGLSLPQVGRCPLYKA